MDRNVLADKIRAKVAQKTEGVRHAISNSWMGRSHTLTDEQLRDQEAAWMRSRTGQRVMKADARRQKAKGQRAYNRQQAAKAQRAITANNMLRATQGEFDHISPHIGRNVRTALENLDRAQSRKPKRARPEGMSKREYDRRAKQSQREQVQA